MTRLALAALVLAATLSSAHAVEVTLDLSLSGDVQRYATTYECETEGTDAPDLLSVDYINADPNFFAIIEIEDRMRVFVSTLSASGVRYASGEYVWWTSGAEAQFMDETDGPDAEPTPCIELTEIP